MNSNIERALWALAEAARTLAKVRSIKVVKDFHDAAEAQIAAARRAGVPKKVHNTLAELSLRAARRIGELLLETPLSRGGRPRKQDEAKEAETLRNLGLSKTQSLRCRRLAAIPDEMFEARLAQGRRVGKAPSAAALLRLTKELGRKRPTPHRAALRPGITAGLSEIATENSAAQLAEELVELEEHVKHIGDLIQTIMEQTESDQPRGVKRRTISVLGEIREIVARLVRRSRS